MVKLNFINWGNQTINLAIKSSASFSFHIFETA